MYSRNLSPNNRSGDCLKPVGARLTTPAVIRLLEDVLNRGLNLRIRVTGMSMTPFLRDGDIVIIRKTSRFSLKTGDLIFFRNRQGLPTVHRIIRKKRSTDNSMVFVTKGDAMISCDEPIPVDEVLGKICKIEQTGLAAGSRTRDLESPQWRLMNSAIALIQRISPSFLIRALNFTFHCIFLTHSEN